MTDSSLFSTVRLGGIGATRTGLGGIAGAVIGASIGLGGGTGARLDTGSSGLGVSGGEGSLGRLLVWVRR